MDSMNEIERDFALPDFVAELRRLADTLEANGSFSILLDEQEIAVPEHAVASVAYEFEDGRAELEFQLAWNVETGEKSTEHHSQNDEEDDSDAAA